MNSDTLGNVYVHPDCSSRVWGGKGDQYKNSYLSGSVKMAYIFFYKTDSSVKTIEVAEISNITPYVIK